jgi:Ran GTPase-activating protein (RanGAP) involved in mRNA processing and transport
MQRSTEIVLAQLKSQLKLSKETGTTVRVIFRNTQFNEAQMKELHELLIQYPVVPTIDFAQCTVPNTEIYRLFGRLFNYDLDHLTVALMNLQDGHIAKLAVNLKHTNIKYLNLSHNSIGKDGAWYLAKALTECQVEHLVISRNDIGGDGVNYLCDAILSGKTKLTVLDVGSNHVSGSGIQSLVEVLSKSSIEALRVSYNQIPPGGLKRLAEAAAKSTCLQKIDLGGNTVLTVMSAIVSMMAECKTLEQLHLAHSNFTDVLLPEFAVGVAACPSLLEVDLSKNPGLSDAGLTPFIQTVQKHPQLKRILLDGCPNVSPVLNEYTKRLLYRKHSPVVNVLLMCLAMWTLPRLAVSHFKLDPSMVRLLAEALGEDPLPPPPYRPVIQARPQPPPQDPPPQ